jgi:polar amino acid transport system permease protein
MLAPWAAVFGYAPAWLDALWLTASMSVLAFVLAFAFGLLGALARRSRKRLLRFLGATYVEVIRNTPVLLQLFMIYFALPEFGLRLDAYQAGVAALAINAGAYLTEVIRAGLQSVPKGQLEAARSLGLPSRDVFRSVVFPQALRSVYPPVVNQFIQLILGSSLVSQIALKELTNTAQTINSQILLTMHIFTVALVLYLLLTNLTALGADFIGRRAFKPPLYPPSPQRRLDLVARIGVMVRGT